jgi:hypothetical protein
MGLADIDKLAALLPTYPVWVRALMFASALAWFGLYGGLVFFAPKPAPPSLTIASFEVYEMPTDNTAIVFDIGVENNTGKSTLIRAADLEFYQDQLPTSGLSGFQEVTATYRVVPDVKGHAIPAGGPPPQPLKLRSPYAGQSYQKVLVTTSQSVEDKKTDRFVVVIAPAAVIDKRNNRVRLTLHHGDKGAASVDRPLTKP